MRRIAAFLLAVLAGCGSKPHDPPLSVYAASSLKEAVTEIAGRWSRLTGCPHRLQFEATSTLARQIQEGAPADVFVAAAPEWLDRVTTLERFDWLSNRLVVVVPKEAKDIDLKTLDSLALANEQVPAGKYAREGLAHLGIAIPERTIYGQNVRDVLSKVSQGGAKAGIVYATDVPLDPNVRIAFTFPPESHSRIVYSVGLLKESGRSFFGALREPWALEVTRKYGFAELE
jgi:molybdate transport system substrate-binding protein